MMTLLILACTGDDPIPVPTDDTASGGVPNILVDDNTVDFGVLPEIGQTAQELISVQNTGDGDLVINGVNVDGAWLSLSAGGLTLTPQSTSQLSIAFQPTEYLLEQSSTLIITSNDPDRPEITIPLIGGVIVDADDDGHLRPEADGGDDCDDSDPSIYPGAPDAYYDGVDSDCAEDDDFDQDGDGYQSDAFDGTDCNDASTEIYPGAPDDWYDGVDSDCAGNNDFDMDQDGFGSKAHNKGKDCNDEDPDAYPGADERLNGKLDDCDGEKDWKVNPNTATVILSGDDNNQYTGHSIAHGDFDDDGLTDTLIGAAAYGSSNSGTVFLIWGSDGFPTDTNEDVLGVSSDYFDGDGSSHYLGSSMVGLDGTDLAIGAYGASGNYGKAYVFDGYAISQNFSLDSAYLTITGTGSHYYVGRGLGASDLDGDGYEDLFFNYGESTSSTAKHRIGLMYGNRTIGSVTASNADSRWTTNNTSTSTYLNMSGGYDLDGDGYDDWVYCDPTEDTYENKGGAVWVLWGQSTEYSDSASAFSNTAEMILRGNSQAATLLGTVCALLPDMDNDGYAELAAFGSENGDLGVLYGDPSLKGGGNIEFDDVEAFYNLAEGITPSQLRPTGDMNSDGVDDFVLGVAGSSSSGGRMYIFSGDAPTGNFQADDAVAYIQTSSDDENNYFSHAVPVYPGDADNDGSLDLLVGDYGWGGEINGDGSTHSNTGAAYVFLAP